MLSACSESCSRLLTSLATERRDEFGWFSQMASASLCHRRHFAARRALACAKLLARFSAVDWSCPSMRDQINGARAVPCDQAAEPHGHLGLVASREEAAGVAVRGVEYFRRLTLRSALELARIIGFEPRWPRLSGD